MKTNWAKGSMALFAVCLAFGAVAEEPSISRVSVRQRWPWSRLADIDYVLTADPTQSVDIVVTAYNGSEQLAIPADAFTGDLYGVGEGAHRIVFDPTKTAYTNSEVLTKFHVSLTPTPVPLYMIVDLTKAVGAAGQVEYIYPGDARLETYGRFTNVWFGVTNDSVYATSKLVMRRIHAGSYKLGAYPPTTEVTLTRDLYAGVFVVTEAQWKRVMQNTSGTTYPQGRVSYNDIRGATNDVPRVDWPSTGTAVGPTNFLGILRAQTGFPDFDLPTCAQWETLCRAGTTSYFNDGESTSVNDTNILKRVAWCLLNASTLYPVGQKEANLWGLYDTLGNTFEWCRDWDGTVTGNPPDPTGPQTGSKRVYMSQNRAVALSSYVPSTRSSDVPTFNTTMSFSFRVVRVLQ